jgi:ATP-dependent Clp protease ATP-binding subunit ClpC
VAWIIPNLHELQYAGAYKQNPTSVLDMLLPEIESGAIAVIGEVSAQAYTRLIEQKRGVRSAFVTIRLEPMGDDAALQLAREWARRRDVGLTEEVLSEAWQLTTQFLGTRAAPGNILGLLDLAVNEHATITVDDTLVALARQTGLPVSILDEREGLDPQALREHFAERVLGQPEAVDVLVERVAMIKAGLTDPTRPFGVFLFAGPTGTGKTEIAKALAAYLFGSAERMIRVDMSELQTAESLSRLLGESDGAVTSLADEIRRQPFSVVLLDEMEKAHRNVLDLFLQVFDDGRLTDRRGNTADFRHTIVILTSNLGSAIPTSGRAGFSDAADAGFTTASVTKAIERELRKELVNRFDRVVVFRPLTRDTMRGILRKELQDALRRRGLRNRDWVVEWDDSALEFLLDQGFTTDLGARPLKRAVERHFLTPLAERIVTRRAPAGDQSLLLRAEEGQLVIVAKI